MGRERGTSLLDRFPDEATDGWRRLVHDVVGGGAASSPLIAALDRPLGTLLDGVDVDAALAAADEVVDGEAPDSEAAARCPDHSSAGAPAGRQKVGVGA